MERFNFDYEIEDYRVRLDNVVKYLEENADEIEYMSSTYIDKLGSYILFAYDKEVRFDKENINNAQYRVLVDNERGLMTHINVVQRQLNQNKKNKVERTEENLKRLYKNIETLFVADENIKEYEKLIKLCDELHIHGQKQSIYDDIGETKKAFITSEVKSKNEVQMKYETLKNLNVEYTDETVKIFLRCFSELKYSEPHTDAHCIYLDLERAMKKCKFTDKQRKSLTDYMNGLSLHDEVNVRNVDFAVKKILKNL